MKSLNKEQSEIVLGDFDCVANPQIYRWHEIKDRLSNKYPKNIKIELEKLQLIDYWW